MLARFARPQTAVQAIGVRFFSATAPALAARPTYPPEKGSPRELFVIVNFKKSRKEGESAFDCKRRLQKQYLELPKEERAKFFRMALYNARKNPMKQSISPFSYFIKVNFKKAFESNNKNFGAAKKELWATWKGLSSKEKDVYAEKAKTVAPKPSWGSQYQSSLVKKSGKKTEAKTASRNRPLSPYYFFVKKNFSATSQSVGRQNTVKALAAQWKGFTAEQKNEYKLQAEKEFASQKA